MSGLVARIKIKKDQQINKNEFNKNELKSSQKTAFIIEKFVQVLHNGVFHANADKIF